MLTTWYSDWYSGLAKEHFIHFLRAKRMSNETIIICTANSGITDHRRHRP